MISKIIILAIALGITVPGALEKGVQDTMNDPAKIEEHQEYEEYADEKIHQEETKEIIQELTDDLNYDWTPYYGEIEAYLEEHDIPYERQVNETEIDGIVFTDVLIHAEKHGILLIVQYEYTEQDIWNGERYVHVNPFSHWEYCTHKYEPCLQLNINN